MNKTEQKDFIYNVLKNSKLFDMDKIDIYHNKNDMLCIREFTYTIFINGIAILNGINNYNKTITLDILKPNYLIHDKMTLHF